MEENVDLVQGRRKPFRREIQAASQLSPATPNGANWRFSSARTDSTVPTDNRESFAKLSVEVFSIFGLTVEDLAAVTQDTTGSSINTFDPVEVIFLKIPVMAISANYT